MPSDYRIEEKTLMIVKCPNCSREFGFEVGKDVVEFGFTCPNCKSELIVTDNKEVVLSSQQVKPQTTSYSVHVQPATSKRHFGCFTKTVLILAVAFILLIFTCPDSRAHKEKIQSVVTSAVDDMLREQDNPLLIVIGTMASTKIVEMAVTDKITVDNYFLFSFGYFYNEGERQLVSIGILNHVFTLSEDQVKTNIREALRKNQ